MQLTGLILFIGFLALFLMWSYRLFSIRKSLHLTSEPEVMFEYTIGVVLFIVIAISAGMAWG